MVQPQCQRDIDKSPCADTEGASMSEREAALLAAIQAMTKRTEQAQKP